MKRAALGVGLFGAVFVTLCFIVLPVVAIFSRVSPGELLHELRNRIVVDALLVTLKTTLLAQFLIVLFGTPTAWFLASRRFRGRSLVVTFVELPIVLPPAVAGIGLLVTFGRLGLIGEHVGWLANSVAFTQLAVVFAVMLVAGPFYVRQGIAAFEAVDTNLIAASRTLGVGPVRTFLRVTLPLASGGLAAGFAICLARGLGEFGATIMFAGSFQGRTQTLSLAVYYAFELVNGLDIALAISGLLVLASVAILLTVKLIAAWRPSRAVAVVVDRSERQVAFD